MIEYSVRVYNHGSRSWWFNGKRHREDGPAVEYGSGGKSWYLNGKRHREDGPAIESSNGDKHWYLNGEKVSEAEHKKRTSETTCEGKVVEIDGIKYKLTEI